MPRRKSVPKKVTKVTVISRRGRRKYRYKRSKGVAGTKWNYSRQKMISVANISAVQGATQVNAVMPFMQRYNVNVGASYGKSAFDSPRWNVVRRAWQEFAITGCKFEYFPRAVVPAAGQAQVYGMSACTMLNASPNAICGYNEGQLASNSSYRKLWPQKPYRKYISFKKLAKEQQCPWQPTNVNTAQDIPNWPTEVAHLLRWETTTDFPAQGTVLGIARYTYYVTFRGQAVL